MSYRKQRMSARFFSRLLFSGILSSSLLLVASNSLMPMPLKAMTPLKPSYFAAMDGGKVDVKFIPLGPRQGKLPGSQHD